VASRPSSGRAPCAPASAGLVAVNGDFFTEQGVPRGGAVLNGEPVRSVTTRKSRHLLVDERGRVAAGDLRLDVALVSADLQRITVDGVNCSLRGVGTVLYTPRYGASTRALEHDCGGLVDGTGRSTSRTSTLPHWAGSRVLSRYVAASVRGFDSPQLHKTPGQRVFLAKGVRFPPATANS
jgi:hypothetical protein